MPDEVIDPDERLVRSPREPLRRQQPDEQRAGEPRAVRDGDAVHVGEREPRLLERAADDPGERERVVSGGDLGHYPSEGRVQLDLAAHDVRQDFAVRGGTTAAAVSSHEVSIPRTVRVTA
jgi:hypothetical protein